MTTATRTATVYLQQSRDGSWIANLAWLPARRTITEGGSEPDLVLRRAVAHLASLDPADRPERVAITKVLPGGQREESERPLAELLG